LRSGIGLAAAIQTPRPADRYVRTIRTLVRYIRCRGEGNTVVKRLLIAMLLLATAAPLVGCVVYDRPGRPGWCYWHPGRC
jgi:hypothetical protein